MPLRRCNVAALQAFMKMLTWDKRQYNESGVSLFHLGVTPGVLGLQYSNTSLLLLLSLQTSNA
jgi:hypothetical protein